MREFYLILPTRYNSVKDSRYKLFEKTMHHINNHSYVTKVVVVDNSSEEVYTHLKTLDYPKMILLDQKDKDMLKGGSIREGIQHVVYNFGEDCIICFQEPEKENMIFQYNSIIKKYIDKESFICIPERTNSSFETYPVEQYHSESYANKFINILIGKKLDIMFGPVIFTGDKAKYWLEFDGKLWDAQIIPIVRAIKNNEIILTSVVYFSYPSEQKKEEEGNLAFIEKRRYQLNYMINSVLENVKNNNDNSINDNSIKDE